MTKHENAKTFPEHIVEQKLRNPLIGDAHPLLFTFYGIFSRGFGITNTELNRALSKYKLSRVALLILFAKEGDPVLKKKFATRLMEFIADVNKLSQTKGSATLNYLVQDYFSEGTREEELVIPSVERAHTTVSQVAEQVLAPIQLQPVLTAVMQQNFGVPTINNRELVSIIDLINLESMNRDTLEAIQQTASPLFKFALAAVVAQTYAHLNEKNMVIALVEAPLRELSVRDNRGFRNILSFLNQHIDTPRNTAKGPRGLFTFEQHQKLSSCLLSQPQNEIGAYYALYVLSLVDPNNQIGEGDNRLDKNELFTLFLHVIMNVELGGSKRVVWGQFLERMQDLAAEVPPRSYDQPQQPAL